jgi:hypothetical protein
MFLAGTAGLGLSLVANLAGVSAGVVLHFVSRRQDHLVEPPHGADSRAEATAPAPAEIEEALDVVLEKLHTSGMGSLTTEERRVLDRASRLYRGRRGR